LYSKIIKTKNMKTLLKNLGAILVLLGVVCLAVYYFSLPENYLLVTSLALEVVGIATYVLVNKLVD
jgi:putative flippase GtrA